MEDPLYFFQTVAKGSVFKVIDSVLQTIAQAYFMYYPLVILSGFITRRPTFCWFHLPRIILVAVYGALRLAVVVFVSMQYTYLDSAAQPEDLPAYRVLLVLSSIVYIFWDLWFLYAIVRTIAVARQHPRVIKGRYRMLIVVLVVLEGGFHEMLVVNVLFPTRFERAGNIIAMWMGAMLALAMGVFFLPTSLERVTSKSVAEVIRPKESSESGLSQDVEDNDVATIEMEALPEVEEEV